MGIMGRERISTRALKTYVDTKFTNSSMANGAAITDDSTNELVEFTKVSSAVNEVNISNNSAGNAPIIAVTGTDDNIGLVINQKAAALITLGTTGCTGVKFGVDQPVMDSSGNEQIKFSKTTSAVNEVTVKNAATNNNPSIASTGSDTNIGLTLKGKGTGAVVLGQATSVGVDLAADQPIRDSATNELIKFVKTTDAVNEVTITNAATTTAPIISSTGGDTNIGLTLTPKGSGSVNATAFNPTFGVSAHDYGAAAVDWTLSAAELAQLIVTATNANGVVNAIATPTAGKVYIVSNGTGYALTFKATGQTGIVVANGKTAILRGNGTDFVRVTADATTAS
jgi:hypothetical protein